MAKWIGVDLDGTLAKHDGIPGGEIGLPMKPMLERVKQWIKDGKEVRIFSARASSMIERKKVDDWLKKNGVGGLVITNVKDWEMIELWDDRAVRVVYNTGEPCTECNRAHGFTGRYLALY